MIIYESYVYKALQNAWAYGRKLVVFCHFHKRFVTKKQLKLHRCAEKKCKRLEYIE